jgi:hypothetical protein
MKKLFLLLAAGCAFVFLVSANRSEKNANPYGFITGTPDIKSISAMTFGPNGILFIGDSKSATIFAVDTKDKALVDKPAAMNLKNFDQKIAAVLGTEAKNLRILDMAVNPLSKTVYLAVQVENNTPVILIVTNDKINALSLADVPYSSTPLNNVPAPDQKDNRGRVLRDGVISDLNYADGSIMVSGISNQEFASTFRKFAFPFTSKEDNASLEIYHAAHGKYETNAPIRTFTTAKFGDVDYLVASYTCTPLVMFSLSDLKGGKHIKGRTVGEFGAGNSPIDMVTVTKGGNSYLVMANTNRPLMRVKYTSIADYKGSLTEQVKESFSTAGVDFVTLPVVNVLQLDKLGDEKVVVIQRKSNGDLDLVTLDDWLFS